MYATASAHLIVLNLIIQINLPFIKKCIKTESWVANPHLPVPLLYIPEELSWSQFMPSVPAA
jgi:hypothetical protein